MTLAPGTRLGSYEIVAPLGAGGMGEVWRARDTRLGRDVAIKALPEAFARDPERLARFEREAKLLASLSHPNIAGIHGLEEVSGRRYLILEYVDGPTLGERLAKGPLPLDEALEVCAQVAAGVEAAHESGVVHRDLKPGNVKITPSGGVKVLDFGLAKSGVAGAGGGSSTDANLTTSPTMPYAATGVGVILGTAAYMSPEQARGRVVDRRTDIWSFGCVLYECLTGRQLYRGETVSDLIAQILEREPDWSALPANVPPRVRELLRRCLRKDARERLRDIGDARLEIAEAIAAGATAAPEPAAKTTPHAGGFAWLVAALGLALAVAGVWRGSARLETDQHLHAVLTHEAGGAIQPYPTSVIISPDGRRVAYIVVDSTGSQLWVRDLDQQGPRRVTDMTSVRDVFWSPDGRTLAFSTMGDGARLWKVPAAGGAPVSICDVKWSRGATWGKGDVIVFAPAPDGPLYRVPAGGGRVEAATTLDSTRHETGHRFPWFLPDGDHFLYAAIPQGPRGWDICVGSLHSKESRRLLTAGSGATYADPGYLLYVRDGNLVAQRFDPQRIALSGDPVPIGDPPDAGPVAASWVATASRNGRLVMLRNRAPDTRVEWDDRSGTPLARIPLPTGHYETVVPSPDGTSILATRVVSAVAREIWRSDPTRGTTTRLTQPNPVSGDPVWLRDGTGFAFDREHEGGFRIYLAKLGGSGEPRLVPTTDAQFQSPTDISRDDRTLILSVVDPVNQFDIWSVPLDGSARPRLVASTSAWEDDGRLSPDDKWLALQSNVTGTNEVYIQPFPGPAPWTRVSFDGGRDPRWSRGGKELLYLRDEASGVSIMAAPIEVGGRLRAGTPRALFHKAGLAAFCPSADGARILVSADAGNEPPPSIALTLDWTRQLRER